MGTPDHRLTTRQMAEFVANGFIRFEAIVPPEINERGIDEMRRLELERFGPDGLKPPHTGTPLDECYPAPSAIGEYLRLIARGSSVEDHAVHELLSEGLDVLDEEMRAFQNWR